MRVLVVASSLLYQSPAVALREGLWGVGALCDNGERSACTSKERERERERKRWLGTCSMQ